MNYPYSAPALSQNGYDPRANRRDPREYPVTNSRGVLETPTVVGVLAAIGVAGALGAALVWLDRKHTASIEATNRGLASAMASAAAAEVTAARSAAAFRDLSDSLPLSAQLTRPPGAAEAKKPEAVTSHKLSEQTPRFSEAAQSPMGSVLTRCTSPRLVMAL